MKENRSSYNQGGYGRNTWRISRERGRVVKRDFEKSGKSKEYVSGQQLCERLPGIENGSVESNQAAGE